MPPRPRPPCAVCCDQRSKYTCVSCRIDYCSVGCYKTHQETCTPGTNAATSAATSAPPAPNPNPPDAGADTVPLPDPPSLRPLTSLVWPYVPEPSAYPDPLTRDDPKPLTSAHYMALATSAPLRTLLANEGLRRVLERVDGMRGVERERAVRGALGVDNLGRDVEEGTDEEKRLFRAFAEAVEQAVRGGREDALGLDWD